MRNDLQDLLILSALFVTPVYLVYWVLSLKNEKQGKALYGFIGFVVWGLLTWFAFLHPMIGCLAGHCSSQPYDYWLLCLEVLYLGTSIGTIIFLHWLAR